MSHSVPGATRQQLSLGTTEEDLPTAQHAAAYASGLRERESRAQDLVIRQEITPVVYAQMAAQIEADPAVADPIYTIELTLGADTELTKVGHARLTNLLGNHGWELVDGIHVEGDRISFQLTAAQPKTR